jgi:adenylylsulfate kinase
MFYESNTRSLVKSISWRVMGTLVTAFLVWLFTRRLTLAAGAGALDAVSKIALFYLHERVWDRVRLGRRQVRPAVIWFTGLSGSGKSTVAEYVKAQIAQRGWRCEHLDGDVIRSIFPSTGFTRADRDAHVRRVGYLASRLESHGIFVIASLISPYAESRDFVRGLCKNFVEVHVSTPLAECERRDVKGLYEKARSGAIKNFTGVDDPYEAPVDPELSLDTTQISVEDAGAQIMAVLDAR